MKNFKEFQGRDLDECIGEACAYFDCPREKLEIEIVQDAKSGIFGIVGARKAKIRVRRMRLPDDVNHMYEVNANRDKPRREKHNVKRKNDSQEKGKKDISARQEGEAGKKDSEPAPGSVSDKTLPDKILEDDSLAEDDFEDHESYQALPIEELDQAEIEKVVRQALGTMLRPIAGHDVALNIDLARGGIRVKVDWQGDAGLLIGREGQTLAALQYLASRIVSKAMGAALHVQLDIGDYRARQEEKLCEIARMLAEKARQHGRPFATRPLSSYHRRVIHMCLQNDSDIQTRSSGEGPRKRVLISPRKGGQS